ncbi:hypothetical protein GZ77_15590 [Endozoicomonas montiporae]|uniref:Uncharacterized protein n=2 Tax=Endozoicomonas montiporae TaxID=1027273 RepID=A0A081N5J5_9GAMM|nr:hypothetical protein [Endozoicomonas montiporae]AMO57390.1 hypothetical protein EZMO1_3399 [Endozoicomonas montiporae CL-33]KEQ13718.1 hypothetical protein GZ77_15590 [Endozoicomonas montiporae]
MDVDPPFRPDDPFLPAPHVDGPGVVRYGPYSFSPDPLIPGRQFEVPATPLVHRRRMQPPQRLGAELEVMMSELMDGAEFLINCKGRIRDKEDIEQVLHRTTHLLQIIPDLGSRLHAYSVQLATGHAPALESDWSGVGKVGVEGALARFQGAVTQVNQAMSGLNVPVQELNRLLQVVFDEGREVLASSRQLLTAVNEACQLGSRPLTSRDITAAANRLDPDIARERVRRRVAGENRFIQSLLNASQLIHCCGQGLGWLCHGAYQAGCYGVGKLETLLNYIYESLAGRDEMHEVIEEGTERPSDVIDPLFEGSRIYHRPESIGLKPLLDNRPQASAIRESVPQQGSDNPDIAPHHLLRRRNFNWPKGPLKRFCEAAQESAIGCAAPVSTQNPLKLNQSQLLKGKIISLFSQPNADLTGWIGSEFSDLETLHAFELYHLQDLLTMLSEEHFQQFQMAIKAQKERLLNRAAHDAIKESKSFENLFAGKIKPDEYDPWQGIDLDSYIAKVEQQLLDEAHRIESSLHHSRKRYRLSEGRDLQAHILMRQLEIRQEEILRNATKDEIGRSLLFYAGDQLDADSVAFQAGMIGKRLMSLYLEMEPDQALPPLDRELSFHSDTLDQLYRQLYKLEQMGCIDSRTPAFASIEQAMETLSMTGKGMLEMYEGVVHRDTHACRKRMLEIVEAELGQVACQEGFDPRQVDQLREVHLWLKGPRNHGFWPYLHSAINAAGPWMKKLLYREVGTVKARAMAQSIELKQALGLGYSAFRCLKDSEIMVALGDVFRQWKTSNPAYFQYLTQHYPELQPHKIATMDRMSLRERVRSVIESEQKNCERGELNHKMPEACLSALFFDLIKTCHGKGFRHQVELENLDEEYRMPLIRLHLNMLCQQVKADGQPQFPFLQALRQVDRRVADSLNMDSLCSFAISALDRTSLSQDNYRELAILYSQLVDDLHRRNSDEEVMVIDGLYSDR